MFKNLDKKQRIELSVTALGVIFLIFLVIGNLQKSHEKESLIETSGASHVTPPISLTPSISKKIEKIEDPDIEEDWGRDPFLSSSSDISDSNLGDLILNGIVWDEDNPYAILNNDVVKIGDRVDGLIVVEINESSIVLEQDGERYTLQLNVF